MLNRKILVSVDVGNVNSGVVVLLEGYIQHVKTMANTEVFETIRLYYVKYKVVEAVIEDIKPFAGNLSQQAIDTCKFIGQLTWRLQELGVKYRLITRSEVRKWVYDEFHQLVMPLVLDRIMKKNKKNNDGKARKPSFIYVNDGIVLKAMKLYWNIATPAPGKGYIYGLQTHTWQALALGSYFNSLTPAFFDECPQKAELPAFFDQKAV